jgi:hypothetical protein
MGCGALEHHESESNENSAAQGTGSVSGVEAESHNSFSSELNESTIIENFVPALNLSIAEGRAIAIGSTFLKISRAESGTLTATQKCSLPKDARFDFSAVGEVQQGHRWVRLASPIPGCSLAEGYVFVAHIRFENRPVFAIAPNRSTRFKAQLADSSLLSSTQWCDVTAGRRYELQAEPLDAGKGHLSVQFAPGQLQNCGFSKGFLFAAHIDREDPRPAGTDFARVMKHILVWEGGCSDHPNDAGGRTFKGITTAVARANGWSQDVCTMPDSLIFEIYRKNYWQARAVRYAWPLSLAVMNTEVNSGGGISQRFLERMQVQRIGGSLVDRARWYVDQQTDYYHRIVASNSSQRVFLRGWTNRSNYMQDVIAGRGPGLALVAHDFLQDGSAKAYFEGELE